MADFPGGVFTPRTTANLPGVVYDAGEESEVFAEDYSLPAAEIVAIEETLGVNPQGAYSTVRAWLDALTSAVSGIVTSFLELSDTPSSYSGQSGMVVKVKSDETGLEFGSVSGATVGAISIWPTTSAPTGFLLCDGSAVSRSTYATLFSVIGTTYGSGNGSTTFNIPNVKGRVVVGYNASETEFDTMGETGGEKTHVLTTAEMPSHTHTISTVVNNSQTGNGKLYNGYGNSNPSSVTSNSTGGDGAHNNLQPYIALCFIIKT